MTKNVIASMNDVSKTARIDDKKYSKLQADLDEATLVILDHLKGGAWREGHSESVVNEKARRQKPGPIAGQEGIRILEEEFVALRLLIFFRYAIRHLRNFLGFIIAAFIVSTISMNSYPFLARRWIGLASVIIFIGIGAAVALVFAEMDRDPLLSRITETRANEVGRAFFFRMARFGALPLLTLLATQFPSISRWLFSWAQPAFEALK
jgi:hypothetical protein